MSVQKGSVFLFSGPSGSGKDTILKQVFARMPELKFSISSTTRARRDPSDDEKYTFLTKEEFETGIAQNGFLEYARYCDNYYGTPAAPIEAWRNQGFDVVIECEVQGALQIMEKLPELTSIFIIPPSVEILRKRLTGRRTESAEQTEKRIQTAIGEMKQADRYEYLVINDHLEDAVDLVCNIIEAQRAKVSQNTKFLSEVLQHA
ncbi:MAG: guanylate kinase [Clostridia bacterium]|nr:guanylate kinase [Clostridia bacterium]